MTLFVLLVSFVDPRFSLCNLCVLCVLCGGKPLPYGLWSFKSKATNQTAKSVNNVL